MLSFLDNWVSYQDTSLPKFSGLTYLFFTILLSSFAIAFDLGKILGISGNTNVAGLEFSQVGDTIESPGAILKANSRRAGRGDRA
jgi:hypothetical protein